MPKEKNKNTFFKLFKSKSQIFLILGFLVFGTIFSWIYLSHLYSLSFGILKPEVKAKGISSNNAPDEFYRRLDGIKVSSSEEANLWPVAIMIENLYSVRPQNGLFQAALVYETYAEAGTTRCLTFYNGGSEKIEKIGPVRSARHYFLSWVYETAALFGHAGGSPMALGNIRDYDTNDFNGIGKEARYFWRDSSISAPHNLFTSSEKIVYGLRDKGLLEKEATFDRWNFKDEIALVERTTDEKFVKVQFSSKSYEVEFKYNRENNEYLRFNGGSPHIDKNNNQQIKAKNVVVQIVPEITYFGEKGRIDMRVEGEGRVLVFRDGQIIEGVWKKSDRVSRTQYYDSSGNKIPFNRGNTWVEVIPEDKTVEYN
jgi:hypothetical protein